MNKYNILSKKCLFYLVGAALLSITCYFVGIPMLMNALREYAASNQIKETKQCYYLIEQYKDAMKHHQTVNPIIGKAKKCHCRKNYDY